MEESQSTAEQETVSHDAGRGIGSGRQAVTAVAVGAIALATIMLLILFAQWRTSAQLVENGKERGRHVSARSYVRYIKVDSPTVTAEPGMLASRELVIKGTARNTGFRTVAAADLRCYFRAYSGGRRYFDFPLVCDTRLDDVGDGPLRPMTDRDFAVRMGAFPDNLSPELMKFEVVNIRLKDD